MAYLNLKKIFSYHAPKDAEQIGRYNEIRNAGLAFANIIESKTPECPEQTLAIRAVQQAVMWANAGIAINEAEDDTNS